MTGSELTPEKMRRGYDSIPDLPPGFRPLEDVLAEIDAEMFEREGIHWYFRKSRARRRLRRRRLWRRVRSLLDRLWIAR